MKKIVTIFAVLTIIVFLGVGCKKDKEPKPDSPSEKHNPDDGEDHSGHDH